MFVPVAPLGAYLIGIVKRTELRGSRHVIRPTTGQPAPPRHGAAPLLSRDSAHDAYRHICGMSVLTVMNDGSSFSSHSIFNETQLVIKLEQFC